MQTMAVKHWCDNRVFCFVLFSSISSHWLASIVNSAIELAELFLVVLAYWKLSLSFIISLENVLSSMCSFTSLYSLSPTSRLSKDVLAREHVCLCFRLFAIADWQMLPYLSPWLLCMSCAYQSIRRLFSFSSCCPLGQSVFGSIALGTSFSWSTDSWSYLVYVSVHTWMNSIAS